MSSGLRGGLAMQSRVVGGLQPQPEQRCLTVPDRQVLPCLQNPQIWRLCSLLIPCCPSLSQCPLPSVLAPLLSCGTAGRSLNPIRSICVRCCGCASQCVSCHLRLASENAARASLLQVMRSWGKIVFWQDRASCGTCLQWWASLLASVGGLSAGALSFLPAHQVSLLLFHLPLLAAFVLGSWWGLSWFRGVSGVGI